MAEVQLVNYEHTSTNCRVSSDCDTTPVFPNVLINQVFLLGVVLSVILEFCIFW